MYVLIPRTNRTKTVQRETVRDAVNKLRWAPLNRVQVTHEKAGSWRRKVNTGGSKQKTDHKMQTSWQRVTNYLYCEESKYTNGWMMQSGRRKEAQPCASHNEFKSSDTGWVQGGQRMEKICIT